MGIVALAFVLSGNAAAYDHLSAAQHSIVSGDASGALDALQTRRRFDLGGFAARAEAQIRIGHPKRAFHLLRRAKIVRARHNRGFY